MKKMIRMNNPRKISQDGDGLFYPREKWINTLFYTSLC